MGVKSSRRQKEARMRTLIGIGKEKDIIGRKKGRVKRELGRERCEAYMSSEQFCGFLILYP